MKPFDTNCVRLTDTVFAPRQEQLRRYLADFDLDRLMHTFRLNAGIASRAEPLGGWEAPECKLRGHFVGHFLSACVQFAYSFEDAELKVKAERIVEIMASCEQPDGYLSAFEAAELNTLEQNECYGIWAPYYTLHKLLAGLTECGILLKNREAIRLAEELALYIAGRFDLLSYWKKDGMLRCTRVNPVNEFGGIGDTLYSLWEVTQNDRILALAKTFDREYFIGNLAGNLDILEDLHANTHLPMILAAAHRYNLTGEPCYRNAVENFYRFVSRRTFANGNSSSRAAHYVLGGCSEKAEHWGAPVLDVSYLTGGESESCCARNTEKLLIYLLDWNNNIRYLDHLEGLKYNALLNAASAHTGLSQYHQPMGSWQTKKFSSAYGDFWCCTGSGLETMAGLHQNLWFQQDDTVFLNMFVSSHVEWHEKNVEVELKTDYPNCLQADLTVRCAAPTYMRIALKHGRVESLRCPAACTAHEENEFLVVSGVFRDGDCLHIDIRSMIVREPISDAEPGVYCLKYGPILLARRENDSEMQNSLSRLAVWQEPEGDFIPLYAVEDERYSVYLMPSLKGNSQTASVGKMD